MCVWILNPTQQEEMTILRVTYLCRLSFNNAAVTQSAKERFTSSHGNARRGWLACSSSRWPFPTCHGIAASTFDPHFQDGGGWEDEKKERNPMSMRRSEMSPPCLMWEFFMIPFDLLLMYTLRSSSFKNRMKSTHTYSTHFIDFKSSTADAAFLSFLSFFSAGVPDLGASHDTLFVFHTSTCIQIFQNGATTWETGSSSHADKPWLPRVIGGRGRHRDIIRRQCEVRRERATDIMLQTLGLLILQVVLGEFDSRTTAHTLVELVTCVSD